MQIKRKNNFCTKGGWMDKKELIRYDACNVAIVIELLWGAKIKIFALKNQAIYTQNPGAAYLWRGLEIKKPVSYCLTGQ